MEMVEFKSLFIEVLKLSPFVAALLYFLMTVWKSMVKKDEILMTTMREHQGVMLTMQRDNITAQNNQAESQRQLAGSIDKMHSSQEELLHEIRSAKPNRVNGSRRPILDPKAAVA